MPVFCLIVCLFVCLFVCLPSFGTFSGMLQACYMYICACKMHVMVSRYSWKRWKIPQKWEIHIYSPSVSHLHSLTAN